MKKKTIIMSVLAIMSILVILVLQQKVMEILMTLLFFSGIWIVLIVVLTTFISIPLWLIDWLVFQVLLGRKTNKYNRFYELSVLWLTRSYNLPFRMSERGTKYGWLGAGLMLISPAAIVTYATAYLVQQTWFPSPLSEENIPYKTHEDIVAITELQDFPTFTYSHNERDGWMSSVTIYYDFEQKLSPAYVQKLETLCNAPDNYLWQRSGKYQYVLRRSSDGKYIKLPIKEDQIGIEIEIGQSGFKINQESCLPFAIEDFAERKTLNKKTGVTFPEYKVVNYQSVDALDPWAEYDLLLDEKPSQCFIQQLENSSKWTKNEDGTYSCKWGEYNQYSETVTVNKNSRVVKAEYESY